MQCMVLCTMYIFVAQAILRDVLKIEKGYHQFIMGPNASIVEMIMEETGTAASSV